MSEFVVFYWEYLGGKISGFDGVGEVWEKFVGIWRK